MKTCNTCRFRNVSLTGKSLGNVRCLEISRDSIYHGYMDGSVDISGSEE